MKNDQEFFVTPVGAHPVLDGIRPFHVTDEAYKNLYISERIKPLLTTDNPTSDVNLAWIGPCRTSRVVAIQLGHGHDDLRASVLPGAGPQRHRLGGRDDEEELAMKLGLYSITYLGLWYRGERTHASRR